MRVLLLKGGSAYDVLRMFTDELAGAFQQVGSEVVVIDKFLTPDIIAEVHRQNSMGAFDLVFSFGIFGEIRDEQGRSIGDIIGAPHVIQYVDYPISHWDRLEQTCPRAAILVVDPSHCEAIEAIYGQDRFGFVGFSPHAAIGETVPAGVCSEAFASQRPIRILFPGTFYRPAPPQWLDLEPVAKKIIESAIELALARDTISALDALDTTIQSFGFDPKADNLRHFRKAATWIHEHVRASRRVRLLETADALGIQMHVLGGNYESEASRFKSIVFGGESNFAATIQLMAHSRVVVNVNANFGSGSHERPLTALNAGAAVASDFSSFYSQNFIEGTEITLFRWSQLESGLASISELADDPERAHAMATAGQRKVVAQHRWINRVQAIVEAGDQARRRHARDG